MNTWKVRGPYVRLKVESLEVASTANPVEVITPLESKVNVPACESWVLPENAVAAAVATKPVPGFFII